MKLWQAKWCPQQHLCHLTIYSSTKFIWLEQSKQFCLKHHQQQRIHLPKLHLLFSITRRRKKLSRNAKTQKGRSVNAMPYSRSSLEFKRQYFPQYKGIFSKCCYFHWIKEIVTSAKIRDQPCENTHIENFHLFSYDEMQVQTTRNQTLISLALLLLSTHIPLKMLLSVCPVLSIRTSSRLTAFSKSSSTHCKAVYHKNHKTLTGWEMKILYPSPFHFIIRERKVTNYHTPSTLNLEGTKYLLKS